MTLKLPEIFAVSIIVSGFYLTLSYYLSHSVFEAKSSNDFWGFLPSNWDHPEPNYVYFNWIAEFFSVITAIPIAGYLLLYNWWKYKYFNIGHNKVLYLYVIIITMYSCAYSAHTTLSPYIMSCTLTAVLTNGVYTFYQYSYITNIGFLQSKTTRFIICLVAESVIIYAVIKLPSVFGEYGGVPTLTVVQTPAVSLATLMVYLQLAYLEKNKSNTNQNDMMQKRIKMVYAILFLAGKYLMLAMFVSFIEIFMARDNAYVFGSFPYLHVTIHILEQIGIYHYGIGVAALQYLVICKEPQSSLQYTYRIPFVNRKFNKFV